MPKPQNPRDISKDEYLKELFFQNTSDLMLFLDTLGRITKINNAGIAFSGFKEEEIIGKLFWTMPGVFSKKNIPKYLSVFKNSLRGKIVKNFQSNLSEKSGRTHAMNFSTFPIIENKKVKSILVIAKDITHELEIAEALQKTKDLYRLIMENTSDLIATLKFDSTYTYLSPSHKKIIGYSAKDLIGKRGFDFVHPDDKKRLLTLLRKYISISGKKIFTKKDSDISENIEYRVKKKDGTWRYLSSTVNMIGDEILLVSKDITESKRKTEETLRESEEKFRNLAEKSPNMIFINKKGKIIYANKICEEILGFKREEFYASDFDFLKLIAPEYRDLVKKYFKRHLSGKENPSFEYALISKKGQRIEVLLTSKLIHFAGENAILGIVTDITDRKRNEEKTRNLKDHLQIIINSASEFIVSFDLNNKISEWNKTAENITGYKKSEIIGRPLTSFDIFENSESLHDYQKQLYNNKSSSFTELILKSKSGSKRVVRAYGSIMSGDDGNAIGTLFIGTDITKDIEMHGKLLIGNSYIIIDKNNISAFNLFMDLILIDLQGLLITRDNPNTIENNLDLLKVKTILLSQEKVKEFENVFDLDDLKMKIKEFIKKVPKSVILLDRIDYLLTIFSFDEVIKCLYNILELLE